MAEKHEIIFKDTGLNSDVAAEFMPSGASPVSTTNSWGSRNIMPAIDDRGNVETVFGNSLLDHGWSKGVTIATVKTLGYATDQENNKVYYILQGKVTGDENPNLNSIVEYDPVDSGTVADRFTKVIWEDAALTLEEDRMIKDAFVVD